MVWHSNDGKITIKFEQLGPSMKSKLTTIMPEDIDYKNETYNRVNAMLKVVFGPYWLIDESYDNGGRPPSGYAVVEMRVNRSSNIRFEPTIVREYLGEPIIDTNKVPWQMLLLQQGG
jgi:hypothetical protein